MPLSKRINEAAEHFLTILFSIVGSFPHASGPETFSCRLTEELVTELSTTPISTFHHYLAYSSPTPTNPPTPDLLLSMAETLDRPASTKVSVETEKRGSAIPRVVTDPAPVITFLRDATGRHLWYWKPRYEPKYAQESATNPKPTIRLKDNRHLKSCLDNCYPTKLPEGALDPFMPWAREDIPLVRA